MTFEQVLQEWRTSNRCYKRAMWHNKIVGLDGNMELFTLFDHSSRHENAHFVIGLYDLFSDDWIVAESVDEFFTRLEKNASDRQAYETGKLKNEPILIFGAEPSEEEIAQLGYDMQREQDKWI